MRSLIIVGQDLNQLAALAAALRSYFRSVVVLHCEDVYDRASLIHPDDGDAVLCCLASGRDPLAIASRLPAACFIVDSGPQREVLVAAGARCFGHDAPASVIAAALAPAGRNTRYRAAAPLLARPRRNRWTPSTVRRRG